MRRVTLLHSMLYGLNLTIITLQSLQIRMAVLISSMSFMKGMLFSIILHIQHTALLSSSLIKAMLQLHAHLDQDMDLLHGMAAAKRQKQ